jgi:hypothetical protein
VRRKKENASDLESRFMSTGVQRGGHYEYIDVGTEEKFLAMSHDTKQALEEFRKFKGSQQAF